MIKILIIAILAVIGVWAISTGLNRAERAECLQWQAQALEYPDWYATDWQIAQCEAHGIKLQ